MRSLMRRLLRRRPHVVVVDEDALQALCALAVIGAACEILDAEWERWHALG